MRAIFRLLRLWLGLVGPRPQDDPAPSPRRELSFSFADIRRGMASPAFPEASEDLPPVVYGAVAAAPAARRSAGYIRSVAPIASSDHARASRAA